MNDFMMLAELCRGKTVYIQTHNFPDPDAIATAYGLQKLLLSEGIWAEICYMGKIDKISTLKMLETFQINVYSYEQLKEKMRETDYIICVDSQKNAGNITDFIGDEVACIDHHPVFTNINYQYSDIRMTGACATIIADYYAKLGIEPDKDTATALLYGLKMDTLQFTRGVTALDISMFGFLHPFCDQDKLVSMERNNMEFSDLKAYGAAFNSIKLYEREGFAFIPFSCPDALIAAISDFILSLAEVDVAIVYSAREDGIKLSVRSETPEIHAGHLIREALKAVGDGGGHACMAGGLIPLEHVETLGNYPEEMIKALFLDAMQEIGR